MREDFFQRKYLNLLIPESAEVDRRHQPSDEDRDKRRLKKQHQKVQKRGEKSEKVPTFRNEVVVGSILLLHST